MGNVKNELGNRYGRLVVIERAGCDYRGAALWRCRCDCGNEKVVAGWHLRFGIVRSCGCLAEENAHTIGTDGHSRKHRDETGNRYGKLVVIRYGGSGKAGSRWVCKCDCGNYTEVYGHSLRTGNTKSCGCGMRRRANDDSERT